LRQSHGRDGTKNLRAPVGDLMLSGRRETLRAFEPLTAARLRATATTQYSEAFDKLEAEEAAAMPAFRRTGRSHADDAMAGFNLKGCSTEPREYRMQLNKISRGRKMTRDFRAGQLRFIPAGFSIRSGAAALHGMRASALRFDRMLPWRRVLRTQSLQARVGRDIICACELRSPAAFTERVSRLQTSITSDARGMGLLDGRSLRWRASNVCRR